MRIWFNPDKLTGFNLTVTDVVAALRAYNVEVSAGAFGGEPAVPGQRLNASIVVQNLLQTPEAFATIPIRTNPDGSVIRIRDVARTELGVESYGFEGQYNGRPTSAMAIRQAAGANALDTARAVKAKMAELSGFFPPGLKVIYPYDTTPFVEVAIGEVVKTLFEAILLVFLVMFLFLGSFRATLIPTIAVPVVILGTFAVLGLFGFSINMLTMFAMVLAIGLLVDDAIVVVENVERIMHDEGLPAKEATAKSMREITSALVGIGLVLAAVFGPMAFFGGSTGVIYRQFSLTIISSMLLSVVVALILTPVLCAALLKPVHQRDKGHKLLAPFKAFYDGFDRWFSRIRELYMAVVGAILARRLRFIVCFLLIVGGLVYLFGRMPTAYLPDEDQGVMMAMVQLPTGSTTEQTRAVLDKMQRYMMEEEKEAVASCFTLAGMSMSGRGQNMGIAFIRLRDWELRQRPDLKVEAVTRRAGLYFAGIRQGLAFAFAPPAVMELGNARGFDFELQDRGGLGHKALMAARNQLLGMAAQDPRLRFVRPNGMEDQPEYRVDVDWEKAGILGVPVATIHNTVSAAFGSGLCQRFHPERSCEACLHPGRRAVPHATRRSGQALLPKQFGRHGALLGPGLRPVDRRVAAPGALQRFPGAEHRGRTRPGTKLGRSHAGHGRDRRQAPPGHRFRLDRIVLPGTNGRHPGRPAVCSFHPGDLLMPGRAL